MDDSQKTIYEITFLANPSLTEADLVALVDKVRNWLYEAGAEMIKEIPPQKRKLSYLVRKVQSAFLVTMVVKGPSSLPAVVDEKIKLESQILRHIFITYTEKEFSQLEESNAKIASKPTIKPEAAGTPTETIPAAPAPETAPRTSEPVVVDNKSLEEIDKKLEEILNKDYEPK